MLVSIADKRITRRLQRFIRKLDRANSSWDSSQDLSWLGRTVHWISFLHNLAPRLKFFSLRNREIQFLF